MVQKCPGKVFLQNVKIVKPPLTYIFLEWRVWFFEFNFEISTVFFSARWSTGRSKLGERVIRYWHAQRIGWSCLQRTLQTGMLNFCTPLQTSKGSAIFQRHQMSWQHQTELIKVRLSNDLLRFWITWDSQVQSSDKCVNQVSSAPPSFRLCCLNCARRFDLIIVRSAEVGGWEKSPIHFIDDSKKRIWRLSFEF